MMFSLAIFALGFVIGYLTRSILDYITTMDDEG